MRDLVLHHKLFLNASIRFNNTAYLPPADDQLSSYTKVFIGWIYTSDWRYTSLRTWERGSGNLSPIGGAISNTPSIYGSDLRNMATSYVLVVNMAGKTIYSFKRDRG